MIQRLQTYIRSHEGIALLATGIVLFAMGLGILHETQGTFMYIQDDPYIHLQIARNLAYHGTWGITEGTFASASSSPLWVLIFALSYRIIGEATLYLPLLINVCAVGGIVVLLMRILARFAITHWRAWSIVAGVALVTPLGPFAFSGMEHAVHMFVVLLFIDTIARITSEPEVNTRLYYHALLLAPLVTALRYEGAFVIACACGILLLRKRFGLLIGIATLGILPILAFGFYSLTQGGYFLPNTLLVKKSLADSLITTLKTTAAAAYFNLKTPLFLLIAPLGLGALWYRTTKQGSFWSPEIVALSIALSAFVLQGTFGKYSWVPMFRYEAYLILAIVLFGLVCLRNVRLTPSLAPRKLFVAPLIIATLFLILTTSPLLRRAISYPYALFNARDLYAVTYHDAQFFAQEYPGAAIGAIDIGMLSYYGAARHTTVVDYWGLASTEVTTARMNGTYASTTMEHIAREHNLEAAVLFDRWLGTVIPSDWHRVATWTLPENKSVGSNVVSFYAPTCATAAALDERMHAYAPNLPTNIELSFALWQNDCN